MSDAQRYSIIFNGELMPGIRRQAALENISQLTNLDTDELLDSLFSVKPVIVNFADNRALAETYLEAFKNAGLTVEVSPYVLEHDEIINVELSFSHYAPIERQETKPNFIIEDVPPEDNEYNNNPPNAEVLSDSGYRVIFNGKLNKGITKDEAVENVCHLTRSEPVEVMEQIFSVVPMIIVATEERPLAQSYLEDFSAAGLVLELRAAQLTDEALALNQLRIRNDAPPAPEKKLVPNFVYLLCGLTFATSCFWGGIYIFNRGYFDQEVAPSLDVKLDYAKVVPTKELVERTPEPEKPEELKAPVTEPLPQEVKPKPEQAKPTTAKNAPSNKKPKAKAAEVSKSQIATIEQNYFLELLNWFAQPQWDSRQSNLEGEIKVRITIDREGKVNNIEVLDSSSERLTEVTRAVALKASPYPKVPKEIAGDSYSFILPFKYKVAGKTP